MTRSTNTRIEATAGTAAAADSNAQPKQKWLAMVQSTVKPSSPPPVNNNSNRSRISDSDSTTTGGGNMRLNVLSSSAAGEKVPQDVSFEVSLPSKEVSSALEESMTNVNINNSTSDDNNNNIDNSLLTLTNKSQQQQQQQQSLLIKGSSSSSSSSLTMKGHHLPPLAAVAKSLAILVGSIAWYNYYACNNYTVMRSIT